jgi:hypothetical protein
MGWAFLHSDQKSPGFKWVVLRGVGGDFRP